MAQVQSLNEHGDSATSVVKREKERLELRFKLHVAYVNKDEAGCLILMDELDRSFDLCREPSLSLPETICNIEPVFATRASERYGILS